MLTPSEQTGNDMNNANLNRGTKRKKLRKTILLGNVNANKITETKNTTPHDKSRALYNIITGKKITKK